MIIFPAVDIREGQVVRLRQGDPSQKTVYGNNPVDVAKSWQDAGANWIHIVNLDGALGEATHLWSIIEDIAQTGLAIQFGGGLRSMADVRTAVDNGVQRAVVGTAAVKNPSLAAELVRTFGAESIVVALDAKDGMVATHGWQNMTEWRAEAFGQLMVEKGVQHALYTDIARDGALEGVNVAATAELARATGLHVVASGGVRSIEDVHALKAEGNIYGVILGKALYDNLIDLSQAIQAAR